MSSLRPIIQILLPLVLGGAILWWMYRGFDWATLQSAFVGDVDWTWMWLSFPFGVLAQVFRGIRWRQALQPLGEHPRLHTCVNAIFLSYASSLVVPRSGEVLRCGVLKRYDGVSFSRGVGTVVTERIIDMLIIAADRFRGAVHTHRLDSDGHIRRLHPPDRLFSAAPLRAVHSHTFRADRPSRWAAQHTANRWNGLFPIQ